MSFYRSDLYNKAPRPSFDLLQMAMWENCIQRNATSHSAFIPSRQLTHNCSNASDLCIPQSSDLFQRSHSRTQKVSALLLNPTKVLLNHHAQQSYVVIRSPLQGVASFANNRLALEFAKPEKPQLPPGQTTAVRSQFQTEQSPFESHVVTCPSDLDVLCGRGGRANHWIGNHRFRELIRKNRAEYAALPKLQKIQLAKALVDVIERSGGRFLEQSKEGEYYVVVSNKRAIEKTSQCLREKRADAHKPISVKAKHEQLAFSKGSRVFDGCA